MKHKSRRAELGKMLMDISKYLVTVGLVSGIIAGNLKFFSGGILFIFAALSAFIGFYVIPKEEK